MFEEIMAPLISTPWGRRSGFAALAIFSLLLLATLIDIPITWHNDYLSTQIPASKISAPINDQILALINQLPNQHIFGESATKAANLPITSLQLHLVGIVEAHPESASSVIISSAGQPGKVYRTGDNLTADVKIKTITRDGVILENDGHMEKLPLSRPPLTFEGMPKTILPGE